MSVSRLDTVEAVGKHVVTGDRKILKPLVDSIKEGTVV